MTDNRSMATNVVELRIPRSQLPYDDLLEQVSVRCIDDIHDAAVALSTIANERGFQVCTCDDISS